MTIGSELPGCSCDPSPGPVRRLSEPGIERPACAFEGEALPHAGWTNQEHLNVGLWCFHCHLRNEATQLIPEGIRRYNHRRDNRETVSAPTLSAIVTGAAD